MSWFTRVILGEHDPGAKHGRPIYVGGPIWRRLVIGYCLLAIGCTGGLYLSWQASNKAKSVALAKARIQHETNLQACMAINNLNKVITATLERSKKNLNHLTYYQEHPKERIQQLHELNRTIAAFKPRTC